MSIASPRSRADLKSYILYTLGHPVIEINISDEQLEIAIQDAIQFFQEEDHFNATDRVLYRFKITQAFAEHFHTARQTYVTQDNPVRTGESGQVTGLALVSAGTGYPEKSKKIDIQTTAIIGSGTGLTVNYGSMGVGGALSTVVICNPGEGYQVNDTVQISGGDNNAVYRVTTVTSADLLYDTEVFEEQRAYVIVPPTVQGVHQILPPNTGAGLMAGGFLSAGIPVLAGFGSMMNPGDLGQSDIGSSYAISRIYAADLNYLFSSGLPFEFNMRSHRLTFNFDVPSKFKIGSYLVFEADVTADWSEYPEYWNDKFLKELAAANAKLAWARNISKYTGVAMPGGLTLNGDKIYQDAITERQVILDKFLLNGREYSLSFLA